MRMLVLAIGAAISLVASSAWPTLGGDAGHTGRTRTVGPQSSRVAWTVAADATDAWDGYWGPLVGSNGSVYLTAHHRVNSYTVDGALRWSRPLADALQPALGPDGTLYVTGARGLFALTPAGATKWRRSGLSGVPVVSPDDGTIYLMDPTFNVGLPGRVSALRPNGSLRWVTPVPGGNGLVAVAPDGRVMALGGGQECGPFFCFTTGQIYALDHTTGAATLLFTAEFGELLNPPIVDANGTIYVTTQGSPSTPGRLYAIDPSGAVLWKHELGPALAGPALGWNGSIYVTSLDGSVYAVKPDGTREWTYALLGAPHLGPTAPPVVGGDGTIYVASQDHFAYALNPNGSLKWRRSIGGIGTYPALANRTLYLGVVVAGQPDRQLGLLRAFRD